MINTNIVYSLGNLVLENSKKSEALGPENSENQIIEDYEGECEKCLSTKPQKACSICGE